MKRAQYDTYAPCPKYDDDIFIGTFLSLENKRSHDDRVHII